jgi:hypothetical protein
MTAPLVRDDRACHGCRRRVNTGPSANSVELDAESCWDAHIEGTTPPVPFTGQTVGGTVAPLTDRASPSGATFCPLCFEHLGGTRAPAAGRG